MILYLSKAVELRLQWSTVSWFILSNIYTAILKTSKQVMGLSSNFYSISSTMRFYRSSSPRISHSMSTSPNLDKRVSRLMTPNYKYFQTYPNLTQPFYTWSLSTNDTFLVRNSKTPTSLRCVLNVPCWVPVFSRVHYCTARPPTVGQWCTCHTQSQRQQSERQPLPAWQLHIGELNYTFSGGQSFLLVYVGGKNWGKGSWSRKHKP